MASARTLQTVVFMGSGKTVTPPWGGDSRLGDRVLKWVVATLSAREAACGDAEGAELVKHEVTVFDPIEVFGEVGLFRACSAHFGART
jgi:hypothetical protein